MITRNNITLSHFLLLLPILICDWHYDDALFLLPIRLMRCPGGGACGEGDCLFFIFTLYTLITHRGDFVGCSVAFSDCDDTMGIVVNYMIFGTQHLRRGYTNLDIMQEHKEKEVGALGGKWSE